MITLERGDHGTYLVVNGDGRDLLVQSDFDFPGVAGTFGWDKCIGPECSHELTDGTVTCKDCGMLAGDFIQSAGEFLDAHIGETAEDPGYFE